MKESHLPRIKAHSHEAHQGTKKRPKSPVGKYIKESLNRVDAGCYQNGSLDIDGGIGDYKMSIFRLKDRNRRVKDIPTIFTKTFAQKVEKIAPQSHADFMKIISIPNDQYLATLQAIEQQKKLQSPTLINKPKYQAAEGDHLFYKYIPEYQKQKWFSSVNDSPVAAQQNNKGNSEMSPKLLLSKKNTRKNDRTHFFRFLDKSLLSSSHFSHNSSA